MMRLKFWQKNVTINGNRSFRKKPQMSFCLGTLINNYIESMFVLIKVRENLICRFRILLNFWKPLSLIENLKLFSNSKCKNIFTKCRAARGNATPGRNAFKSMCFFKKSGRRSQCYTRTQCLKKQNCSKCRAAGGNATPGHTAFKNIGDL